MSHRTPLEHLVPATAERLLPHLNAAHNLARWLLRNEHDAEDLVHDAFMRACRYDPRGGLRDARAWLLAIVRNRCYDSLRKRRLEPLDEEARPAGPDARDPEREAVLRAEVRLVDAALADLPPRFREILVLREMEGLSYKEIARVLDVPIGTVMSTLSRARARLRALLRTTVGAERTA